MVELEHQITLVILLTMTADQHRLCQSLAKIILPGKFERILLRRGKLGEELAKL